MTGGVVTRFAPSPTGRLHLGHAFSAIRAHDFARARGGRFLLRIEDIDATRSRPEHVAAIRADLEWLGLEWDEAPVFQSERLALYRVALDQLKARGLVYPCFCTRADIAAAGAAPHGPDGPVYPGTCRELGEADRGARMGEPHAWRLDMAKAVREGRDDGPAAPWIPEHVWHDGELVWHDELAGPQRADPAAFGDVVLARKDAAASYHLAVTIDDAAQGVTHIVRGADLFAATHVHRLLQALLGLSTPIYHHHPLLTDAAGNRLAKRSGAPGLEALRLGGVDGHMLADELRAGRLPTGFSAGKD